MQLQNQKKRFLFNLFYNISTYDPEVLLYENLLHTPHTGEIFKWIRRPA